MPIEITELIVRARVDADQQDEQNARPASTPSAANTANNQGTSPQVQNIEKAVREAIILIKRKNER